MTRVIGWVAGLTALFMILYYYVGTTQIAGGLFSGTSTLVGTITGRDAKGNLPSKYPK